MDAVTFVVLQVDRGDEQHRRVHRSGDRHRQHDVDAGDQQQPAPLRARLGVAVPVQGQARMHVHGVRHHGGAQDGGGQQHAFGAAESWQQAAEHGAGRGRRDEETGREADGDDQQQPGDDALEKDLAAAVLDRQQQHRDHAGDHSADQQRQIEQDVQGDGSADDFGGIGGDRHEFGLHPKGQPQRTAHPLADRLGQ